MLAGIPLVPGAPATPPARLDPALPAAEAWAGAVAAETRAALSWLDTGAGGDEAARAIHECRRACKRLRALLRLGEPAAPGALREMRRWVAAAARALAPGRDAGVAAQTLDALLARYAGGLDAQAFAPLQAALRARAPQRLPERAVSDARTTLESVLESLHEPGAPAPDDAALERGVAHAWRRMHRLARKAAADADDDSQRWHRLRGRVVVVRSQLRAVRELTGGTLRKRERWLKRLAALLGAAHDRAMLRKRAAASLEAEALDPLLPTLLEAEERAFYRRARPLARRLTRRPASRLALRLSRHWRRPV